MGLIQKTGKLETVESAYSQLTVVKDPKEWDRLVKQRALKRQKNAINFLLKNKSGFPKKFVNTLQTILKKIEKV